MRSHLQYLSYVLRHKWYVFLAGLKTGAPLWRLIIHDWSKFTPREWFPYVDYFYVDNDAEEEDPRGEDGSYDPASGPRAFNYAWNAHQHRNPHHWQHWVLREDSGDVKPLPMPFHFVQEMVADWMGASMAQGHGWDTEPWYRKNRHKMALHITTEHHVEYILGCVGAGELP